MFNAKRNDVSKFTHGAWMSFMGAKWKVARAGNPVYEKALEESGYRKAESPEQKQRALHEAIAKGVLLDWGEGDVVDNDGHPIPYSVENCATILAENPDLVNRVIAESNDLSHYRREDVGAQAKKLQTTSSS